MKFTLNFESVLSAQEKDGVRYAVYIGETGLVGIFWSCAEGVKVLRGEYRHGLKILNFPEQELSGSEADDAWNQIIKEAKMASFIEAWGSL